MPIRAIVISVILFCVPSISLAVTTEEKLDDLMRFTCSEDMSRITSLETEYEDLNAQYHLAYFYLHGICKEQNIEFGIRLMTNAADQRHTRAAFAVAELFYHGTVTNSDMQLAKKYFLIAADGGHLIAQHRIGMIFMKNAINEEQRWQGLYWLGMAANQGDGFSAFMLGVMHQNGMNGLPEDECLALDWYEASKSLGFVDTTGFHSALSLKRNQDCN